MIFEAFKPLLTKFLHYAVFKVPGSFGGRFRRRCVQRAHLIYNLHPFVSTPFLNFFHQIRCAFILSILTGRSTRLSTLHDVFPAAMVPVCRNCSANLRSVNHAILQLVVYIIETITANSPFASGWISLQTALSALRRSVYLRIACPHRIW